MVPGSLLMPLSLATTASLFGEAFALLDDARTRTHKATGSYIIELADDAAEMILSADDVAASLQRTLQSVLTAQVPSFYVNSKLNYTLFRGLAVTFHDVENAGSLASHVASHASVKQVWPNYVATPNTAVDSTLRRTASGRTTNHQAPGGQSSDYPTGAPYDYEMMFAPHIMSQVNKLHQKGIFGNGTKVALIDSGIDYSLQALGGCFGTDCLVSYGYDLVGDDYNGYNAQVPDNDPFSQCFSHGTHCAGILAAQPDNKYGIVGVAPGVMLGMYRVFGCKGVTFDDVLIQAAMMAYEDGSDILTTSVASDGGWGNTAFTVVAERIVKAGVPFVISGGNGGEDGPFGTHAAGDGNGVASIASFDPGFDAELSIHTHFTVNGRNEQEFHWLPATPDAWSDEINLPLWAVNYNISNIDAGCSPYPAETPDLSRYIVLVSHTWNCSDEVQAQNAADYGAKYIIFYANDHCAIDYDIETTGVSQILAVATVSRVQGVEFVKLLAAKSTVTVQMARPPPPSDYTLSYSRNTVTGGAVSFLTTMNPTYELNIKPQFGAAGTNILSTVAATEGGWAVHSGSSMATPFVAGVYALIRQVRSGIDLDPATYERLLSATAKPQLWNWAKVYDDPHTLPWLAPVCQQGAGLIQAYDAAYTTTLLSRSSFSFNDTEYLEPNTNFTIRNIGKQDVTYNIGHVSASTVYAFSHGPKIDQPPTALQLTNEFATIEFDDTQVTVPTGGEVLVSLTITPPNLDSKRIPIYSGYIILNGTNGDNLSMPYNGVAGRMKDIQIFAGAWLAISSDPDLKPVNNDTIMTFTIPSSSHNASSNVSYPVAYLDPAFGSRQFDVQLIEWNRESRTAGRNLGSIYSFPWADYSRWAESQKFNGTMADMSMAQAGTYLFEFSALPIFGNLQDPNSYQRRQSIPFTIEYF